MLVLHSQYCCAFGHFVCQIQKCANINRSKFKNGIWKIESYGEEGQCIDLNIHKSQQSFVSFQYIVGTGRLFLFSFENVRFCMTFFPLKNYFKCVSCWWKEEEEEEKNHVIHKCQLRNWFKQLLNVTVHRLKYTDTFRFVLVRFEFDNCRQRRSLVHFTAIYR